MNRRLKQKHEDKYLHSAEFILNRIQCKPNLAIVAGSGFSGFCPGEIIHSFKYSDIPEFPIPTVAGHCGELNIMKYEGSVFAFFAGRFHIYEGRSLSEICSQVICSKLLGINNVLLTNACGGLNIQYRPGELMIAHDLVNFTFRDTEKLFEEECCQKHNEKTSREIGDLLYEDLNCKGVKTHRGSYTCVTGPSYETPAEIRMFRRLGFDTMGMSTVHEAKVASALGMNVVACSLITNSLKETATLALSHNEVVDISNKSENAIKELYSSSIHIFKNFNIY